MRVYYSADLVGVEIGGAVKNVMAIAAGISDGLGLGYNARAALITRGLAEIARLGAAMGGLDRDDLRPDRRGRPDPHRDRRPVAQPARRAGAGAGPAAREDPAGPRPCRRRRAFGAGGRALAAGKKVDMPVTDAVNAVLEGKLAPKAAVEQLLSRDPKQER